MNLQRTSALEKNNVINNFESMGCKSDELDSMVNFVMETYPNKPYYIVECIPRFDWFPLGVAQANCTDGSSSYLHDMSELIDAESKSKLLKNCIVVTDSACLIYLKND